MAKVRKPRIKKVDLRDIEAAEELPKEKKIKSPETNYNKESEDFLRQHGLIK